MGGDTGDSNFDGDKIHDRLKKASCCFANLGWCCVCWVFSILSLGLVIVGLSVTIVAAGFNSDDWFGKMVKKSGIEFEEGEKMMEKMTGIVKTVFVWVGVVFLLYGLAGCLVIYCRKCACSCLYVCCTSLLFIFVLVVSVPVFAVWGMDDNVVIDFCKNDYDKLPFKMGEYFTEHPDMHASRFDKVLNKPAEILCSDACPCVAVEQTKWPKATQAEMVATRSFDAPAAGRTWNFTGTIKSMKECVTHLKDPATDPKYVCWALKKVNQSELVRENKNKEIKKASDVCSGTTQAQQAAALDKVFNGVFMNIYEVLEGDFKCQSVCKTSPFYMTKDVTSGAPKEGCAYTLKNYVDDYAASWGGGMIFFMLYIICLWCSSCSTITFTGAEANEFTNKDGSNDKGGKDAN